MDNNIVQFSNPDAQRYPENPGQPTPGYYNMNAGPQPSVPVAPFGGNVAGNAGQLQPTSMQELLAVANGSVVRFPDFAEGMPFVARVRRPSMLVLAKSGKIPNALMKSASQLFTGDLDVKDADAENMLKDVYSVCEIIAEASLIQPSWADLKNAGVELSDDQMMAIFNYSQNGIKALQSFR